MSTLIDIIKNDLNYIKPSISKKSIKNSLNTINNIGKELGKGFLHGLYTPFLLNTGGKQLINIIDKEGYLMVSNLVGRLIGGYCSQAVLINYAVSQGKGKEYAGLIITSNIIDYLLNAYKRAQTK